MSDELLPKLMDKIRRRTPARLFLGRSGGAYPTLTQLQLRAAHAAARDAVRSEFNLTEHLSPELVDQFGIFEVCSAASSKDEYLSRPDMGRRLSAEGRERVAASCRSDQDLQIVIGDGLSTTAVRAQVPSLLPALLRMAAERRWSVGRPFAVRFCRVGILNDIGELLRPAVAVLLIGERPGLATAESLSAYMAFRPHQGQTDADRNLISNIHARGVKHDEAATRIINLAATMMSKRLSGTNIREELPSLTKDGRQLSRVPEP